MPLDIIMTTARKITPGTPVDPGAGVIIACSVAGKLTLVMKDGSLLETYATLGTSELVGYAVKDINAAGTTATATVSVVN